MWRLTSEDKFEVIVLEYFNYMLLYTATSLHFRWKYCVFHSTFYFTAIVISQIKILHKKNIRLSFIGYTYKESALSVFTQRYT